MEASINERQQELTKRWLQQVRENGFMLAFLDFCMILSSCLSSFISLSSSFLSLYLNLLLSHVSLSSSQVMNLDSLLLRHQAEAAAKSFQLERTLMQRQADLRKHADSRKWKYFSGYTSKPARWEEEKEW